MRNLISHVTSWSGLSGPIPNAGEMRRKREEARLASLGINVLGHPGLSTASVPQPKRGA
jgi:hypothetical protein